MRLVLHYESNGVIIKNSDFPTGYLSFLCGTPPGPNLNRFKGIITEMINLPSVTRAKIDIDGSLLYSELSTEAVHEMDLRVGREVFVIIKLKRIRYADR